MKKVLVGIQRLTKRQWWVVAVVCAAAFLRFYNLEDSVQFLGDQGRDALVVSKIFRQSDPVFIGPVTSVGNMYLGPFYYYFMLPFLWLTYPSPMGPVYAVAFIGVLTVFLVYKLGKEIVGEKAALIAMTLFAFSSAAVAQARFSWNPNLAPFFSIVMVWAVYRAYKQSAWYWILVALCSALLVQLHYVTLLAVAAAGSIALLQALNVFGKKSTDLKVKRTFVLATVVSLAVVALTVVPLVLFDSKHGWLNYQAFLKMFQSEDNFTHISQSGRLVTALFEMHGRSMHIMAETIIGKQRGLNTLFVILLAWLSIRLLLQKKKRTLVFGQTLILWFVFVGIVGTAFYQHTVFDHYIAYLFPLSSLMLGFLAVKLLKFRVVGPLITGIFVFMFIQWNSTRYPIGDASWKLSDISRTSDTIAARVKPGEKYNIVLLSETGDIDAQNYRYFLTATDTPPVEIEQRGEVETLFIINEDRVLPKVVDSPIYEIVVFPNKQPSEVYEVLNGPEITVLRKSE